MKLGDLEFHILNDGTFGLDGGAMFGVIPRPMWERVAPPDDRNRIRLRMNSLLIRSAGKLILVETGAGDKFDAKRREIYKLEGHAPAGTIGRARREAGAGGYRCEHAPAFRPLRLEHADDRREAGADVSERALHHPAGRARACAPSERARPGQLLPGKLRADGQDGAVVADRKGRRDCAREWS